MITIIGNILLLFSALYGDISLRMTDSYGSPLKQAGIGQPFKIEVTVTDNRHIGTPPSIEGLDQFNEVSNSTHITIINGQPTAKYFFGLIANEPGIYYVGPARYGNDAESNRLKVVVDSVEIGTEKKRTKGRSDRNVSDEVFVQLKTDKQKVSVGEKVECSLKFYYIDPTTSIRNFSTQESNNFKTYNSQSAQQSKENLDGKEYYCIEWKWDLYPTKAGKLSIPPYAANYEQQSERENLWGGLGRFFGNRVEAKRSYSNSVTLQVDPIPESDQFLNGIGSFSYIHLSVQPPVARQGEGVLVTVEIGGEGDPDAIEFNTLQDIPEALKSYQSNQEIISPLQPGDIVKKKIEFVIQGLSTGSFEIPSQKFNYYDVYARKFKSIESAPLTITILPGLKKNVVKHEDPSTKHPDTHTDIRDIHTEFYSTSRTFSFIPYWLFLMLTIFPMLYLFSRYSIKQVLRYIKRKPFKRSAYAYKHAVSQLNKLKSKNKAEKLYSVFIEYFADKADMMLTFITPLYIQSLIKKHFDIDEQKKWEQFFTAIRSVHLVHNLIKSMITTYLDRPSNGSNS